uniref:RNA polymerase II-associated factor 1 homolog n=1 Tax=Hyaloperonospora arabidopsidis (strain Emoy2) TaxID=559515 RepID=M4BID8_HYAAE
MAATAATDGKGAAAAAGHSKGRRRSVKPDEAQRRRAIAAASGTSEERARYELERKKVAKYKEDKLKARRDHTRMILESHAQAKRRALLGKQSEFLATLEFRNTLPDIPFDTKFVKYPHESERLIKYKPNALEMDYTYEIHEEANLGLTIDLIDPVKYEAPAEPEPLEVGDEQALMMREDHVGTKGRSKVRPTVSWLRRTEYMGNDLYDSVHKFKSEAEIQNALREGTENALAEVVSVSLEDRAEASFRDINDSGLLVHPHDPKKQVAKVWDVFPDQLLFANKYAILSYDMLPSEDFKNKGMSCREERALLCGVNKKIQAGNELIQGSVLLPNAPAGEEVKLCCSDNNHVTKTERNFVLLYFRRAAIATNFRTFESISWLWNRSIADVLNRIQLRKTKMSGEEKRRDGIVVYRRDYSEGENDRRARILFHCGGVYDEQLDDDESVREHKRRRMGDNHTPPLSDDEDTEARTPPGSPTKKSSSPGCENGDGGSPDPRNGGSGSPVISDSDSE